jgi:hypothetical protein
MRNYSGKILLRLNKKIHSELAEEAFKTGRSINQLCLEAILARKVLKEYNPWVGIKKMWKKNKRIDEQTLDRDIKRAVQEVRRGRQN